MSLSDRFLLTTPPEILFSQAEKWLSENYPEICGGLLFNQPAVEPEVMNCAYDVLERYARLMSKNGATLESSLEKFCQLTFDFIRLQTRFMKTGKYRRSSAQELITDIYDDPSKMEGYYLDGLLLTYALWPNHVRMLRFFARDFLDHLNARDELIEIGVGHGLMACLALELVPGLRYCGLDISRSSIDFSSAFLSANEVSADRYKLLHQDATKLVGDKGGGKGWNAAMCCEVLEHVENPPAVLALLRDSLAEGGKLYITTVANIEAEDHIFLFHDADHIRRVLREGGFRIDRELGLPLKGMEKASPLPLNYAAALTRI